ncbi:MAG: hypothetical protein RL095_1640 [Verrucomicrobiota bacterium]|jgi:HD-like signal output (HDOD) protein
MSDLRDLILDRLSNTEHLPQLPSEVIKLLSLSQDDHAGLNEAVKLIKGDPPFALRVLRLANSARFGGAMKVTALEVAASRLGMETLRMLALTESLSGITRSHGGGYSPQLLFRHGLHSALAADLLAPHLKSKVRRVELFTAGLLHISGMLVMEASFPRLTAELVAKRLPGETLFEAEMRLWGISSGEAGEHLCLYWNLPVSCGGAARYHLAPPAAPAVFSALAWGVHAAKAAVLAATPDALFTPGTFATDPHLADQLVLDGQEVQPFLADIGTKAAALAADLI